MIDVVQATEEHLPLLGANARPEEVDEVYAARGTDVYTAAKIALERSSEAYSAFWDDKLLGIVGLVPLNLLTSTASPWLLTTNESPKRPRHLLTLTRKLLPLWVEEWDVLENYIDARYEASLRWAKWSGFTIHEPVPYGVMGLPFHWVTIGV